MVRKIHILLIISYLILFPCLLRGQISFDFFGTRMELPGGEDLRVPPEQGQSVKSLLTFVQQLEQAPYRELVAALQTKKEQLQLDDWLYYQLIRKTAQQLSPKAENYYRYTLYKWFLLSRSGYASTLREADGMLLFYVQSDEEVYNIPYYEKEGRQFVCLNYHDYGGNIDFSRHRFEELSLPAPAPQHAFTYRVQQLPAFGSDRYTEKELGFTYGNEAYRFKVKINNDVQQIFANYPVLDYAASFNIPLSRETYASLIPALREKLKGQKPRTGVDFLMRFTRYAFLFEPDSRQFGQEKRLSPEQTLLYEQSDCEDRAALFFYLVKEIYNLPMIVLSYPEHVTVAVQFDKPLGKPIEYNGRKYTVCEPTPQKKDLGIGQMMPDLAHTPYTVVYAYNPTRD